MLKTVEGCLRAPAGSPHRGGWSARCWLSGVLLVEPAAGAAWATLRKRLVDELIDALIGLRLLRVGLIGRQATIGDRLVDTLVRGVLERRRDVGRGLTVRLGDLRQRLALNLGAQLLWGDAEGGGGGVQVTAEAFAALAAAATAREALALRWKSGVRAGLGDGGVQVLSRDVQALGEGIDEALVPGLCLLARRRRR